MGQGQTKDRIWPNLRLRLGLVLGNIRRWVTRYSTPSLTQGELNRYPKYLGIHFTVLDFHNLSIKFLTFIIFTIFRSIFSTKNSYFRYSH